MRALGDGYLVQAIARFSTASWNPRQGATVPHLGDASGRSSCVILRQGHPWMTTPPRGVRGRRPRMNLAPVQPSARAADRGARTSPFSLALPLCSARAPSQRAMFRT